MEAYIRRGVEARVRDYLDFFPIVHITGARQVGKSTLTQHLGLDNALFVTLDDPAALSLATSDPVTFLQQAGNRTLVIDEIQRRPELTLALKAAVDSDRRPGRFIITGSSDLARAVGQKDSLAGRVVDVHLEPLAQQELSGTVNEGAFADRVDQLVELPSQHQAPETVDRAALVDRIIAGGYPVAHSASERMRKTWLNSYMAHVTVVEETLPRETTQPARLQALMRLIAARQAGELVPSKLAREADLPASTVRNYIDTLERLYLVSKVKAWKANLTSREISKPKAWVSDSGLASVLAGQNRDVMVDPLQQSHFGHLAEAFVLQELSAQRGWAESDHQLFHWRDSSGMEVDAVLEYADGSVVAIEVKSGATVKADHAKHLQVFREKLGPRFKAGFVIAPIDRVQPLGDKIVALPYSFLWRG